MKLGQHLTNVYKAFKNVPIFGSPCMWLRGRGHN